MAPRLNTIKVAIENALKYIAADKCAGAERILGSLSDRLSGSKKPVAPNKYALFVKSAYKRVAAANPSKTAPEVMKLIAAEWNGGKSGATSRSRSVNNKK